MAFEQTFKNLDDVLWKEAGCSSELDYTEQTSWLLFLKYLDFYRRRDSAVPDRRARGRVHKHSARCLLGSGDDDNSRIR